LPAKQKKILKFLNRMKVLFTKEVIQQIDSHANKIKIAHEEEAIEDPIINLIFNQAA
jgi:hypothetical protein